MGWASTTITTSQTWNWPAGVRYVIAEALGSGGAGGYGAANPAYCGGGKGGGYAKKKIIKGTESSLSITVGTGGDGSVSGGSGYNGAATTIVQNAATVLSAQGGAGVATNGTTGATGTVGSATGDTTWGSGNGANSSGTNSGAGGGAGGTTGAGSGQTAGSGTWLDGSTNQGAGGASVAVRNPGNIGGQYGGGGSGGSTNQNTDRAGGNGYDGVVMLTWETNVVDTIVRMA